MAKDAHAHLSEMVWVLLVRVLLVRGVASLGAAGVLLA